MVSALLYLFIYYYLRTEQQKVQANYGLFFLFISWSTIVHIWQSLAVNQKER